MTITSAIVMAICLIFNKGDIMSNLINYVWFFVTAIIALVALIVVLGGLLIMLGGLL